MLKLIHFDWLDLLIGLFTLACLLFVLWRQRRSLPYLIFFSGFWLYVLFVVSRVVFPIVIDLNDSNASFIPGINLIPLQFEACSVPLSCIAEVVNNILLTVPFGFGMNFLIRVKPRSFSWLAPATGLVIELSQLLVIMVFRSHFHLFDINDVILNSLGVLMGYAIFRVFALAYVKMADHFDLAQKWLMADIYAVASYAQDSGKSKRA